MINIRNRLELTQRLDTKKKIPKLVPSPLNEQSKLLPMLESDINICIRDYSLQTFPLLCKITV